MKVDIINCHLNDDLGAHEVNYKRFSFNAKDCGGKLPDVSYEPFVTRIYVCGGMDNFEVHRAPQPGITLHGLRMPCGGHKSEVAVRFIKFPR